MDKENEVPVLDAEQEAQQSADEVDVAVQLLNVLFSAGGNAENLINIISTFNGMFCCGMIFTVLEDNKPRRKAYKIQQDIAKLTRKGIEAQKAEDFESLSFEGMFTKDDIH